MNLQINGIEKVDDIFEMQFQNENLKLMSGKKLWHQRSLISAFLFAA